VATDAEIAQLSVYPIVSGHFALRTLLRITAPSSVATVLREPGARLLSNYAFWRIAGAQGAWGGSPWLDHARRPLDEFLAEPLVADNTDNLYCRMLLRGDKRIPGVGFISAGDIPAVARAAAAALETLGFVGVLELGESLLQGLSTFFEIPLAPIRLNSTVSISAQTPGAEFDITTQTLDLLEARTAADAIVYRHALAIAGCTHEQAERIAAAAFASQLFRVGNLIGASASDLIVRLGEIAQLKVELDARDDEFRRLKEDLGRHRAWLDSIQGSVSWRTTAPARAAKRALTKRRP
jgi:hypothetical protein